MTLDMVAGGIFRSKEKKTLNISDALPLKVSFYNIYGLRYIKI
jgi:hypothetical protein